MIYKQEGSILVRKMKESDPEIFCKKEIEQGWINATPDKHWKRLTANQEGRAIPLVAEYENQPVGYLSVYLEAKEGPFAKDSYPELVDFAVLEKCRGRGIGTALMDVAERIAGEKSKIVTIGVGLHSGYGNAQRMYVKRGYIPDGSGVWYQNKIALPYGECCNDDALVLYFSKRIQT